MSTKLTDLVGYRYDLARKAWLGAFFIGAFSTASTGLADGHYELLSLDQIKSHEQAAKDGQDTPSLYELAKAERAIQDTIDGKRAAPNDLPADFNDKLFSASNDGDLYKVIDSLRDQDWTSFTVAQKTARVKAERVPPGTRVETIMANGVSETGQTAGPNGGYKVTAQTGEQYLVDVAKFERSYDQTDAAGVYAPKSDPRKVLDLPRNVAFTAPWGEEMRIKAGGVLVNGGGGDVYGIQPDEFRASYSSVPRLG